MNKDMVSAYKIGEVVDYDARFHIALIRLDLHLKVGDTIQLSGVMTDFQQTVESMKKDKEEVKLARSADEVHIVMEKHVKVGDAVVLVPRA